MADSLLKASSASNLRCEADSENIRRNASASNFRPLDREIDSCLVDSCLFQAVNYYERSSQNFPTTQSAFSTTERVSESNRLFQDYLPQQPELLFSSEFSPAHPVHHPHHTLRPQLPSLESTTTLPNMISSSLLFSSSSVNWQSSRTSSQQPAAAASTDRSPPDRQQMMSRSEPNLSSTSFTSIVAWRRNFNVPAQGDCLSEGDTCHTLAHTPLSSLYSVTASNHPSVSDSFDGLHTSENITSRRAPSTSDSGRSSPSSEFILSTSLGYALTPRGNVHVRPDNNNNNNNNIPTNLGARPSGRRLNSSALRVLRSQSPRGSTSIRSRRISSSSRSLSPLNIGLALYHPSNDGDNLPILLSPSDRSDRDRPPTPTVSVSEAGSQTLSEGSRSRFIHPGTPIQMHLPELPSLLEVSPSDHRSDTSGSEVWLMSSDTPGAGGAGTGGMTAQEDEDVFGCDKERAKELLDGLEFVKLDLVRRYEKVRGEDICIICRDTLLRQPRQQTEMEDIKVQRSVQNDTQAVTLVTETDNLWNLDALSFLPFSSSSSSSPLSSSSASDCSSIHAFPCAHLFHTTCLFPWLSIKTTCPTCRLDIDPHSLTLRIRQWSGISDNQEPTYVNVDILGRRIPWHKPPAPSIEEWIQAREIEMTRNNKQ